MLSDLVLLRGGVGTGASDQVSSFLSFCRYRYSPIDKSGFRWIVLTAVFGALPVSGWKYS